MRAVVLRGALTLILVLGLPLLLTLLAALQIFGCGLRVVVRRIAAAVLALDGTIALFALFAHAAAVPGRDTQYAHE
jgi:hypothetical protein